MFLEGGPLDSTALDAVSSAGYGNCLANIGCNQTQAYHALV